MRPGKKAVKAEGGIGMRLFEELDEWIEKRTGGGLWMQCYWCMLLRWWVCDIVSVVYIYHVERIGILWCRKFYSGFHFPSSISAFTWNRAELVTGISSGEPCNICMRWCIALICTVPGSLNNHDWVVQVLFALAYQVVVFHVRNLIQDLILERAEASWLE